MADDNTPVYSTTTPPPNADSDSGDTGSKPADPDVTGTSVQDAPVSDNPTVPDELAPSVTTADVTDVAAPRVANDESRNADALAALNAAALAAAQQDADTLNKTPADDEPCIVYIDENGERQRITLREYRERGL
jgi:hypothetical protein